MFKFLKIQKAMVKQLESLEAERDRVRQSEAEAKAALAALTEQQTAFREAQKTLKDELSRLETEKTALEDRETALTRGLETLSSEKQALTATVDTLRARIGTLETEKAVLAAAQSDAIARLEFLEKEKIGSSRYWDYMWYIKTYHHDFTRAQALDYWYRTGWKLNENPCSFIDVGAIRSVSGNINPVIFLLGSNTDWVTHLTANPYEDRIEEHVERYREAKKARTKCEGAVYTCVTGQYDSMAHLKSHEYLDPAWDYILYTDNESLLSAHTYGAWDVRPLEYDRLDPVRNSRWHKTHPHVLLQHYDQSLWADGNVNILTDFLFQKIRTEHHDLLIPRHFARTCIYQEATAVKAAGIDDPALVDAEVALEKAAGFPANYGLNETNILYRRHKNPEIIQLMEEWWAMIEKYSKRDQLALSFILWKHGITVESVSFENTRLMKDDFFTLAHR